MRAEPQKRAPQPRDEAAAHEIDRRIVARAAGSEGIVTTAVLLGAGLSHGEIVTRVRHGWLVRRHHGVYLVGAVAGPLAEEMAAVQAIGEDSGLSYGAAGALWRVRSRVDGPIDVSVAGRHARSRPGIRVHNVRTLERTVHRGIPVTTPARTLLDLAATTSFEDLARAVEQARVLRLVTDASLREIVERNPHRPGTCALLRTLAREPRLTRSQAEAVLLELVRRAGLPLPATNLRVLGHEVDDLWREDRLIVEVDGFDPHGTRMAFERDRRRDAELVAAGYRVIRITWRQLMDEPEAVVARLAGALARRPR
jgi:very-short-patch-repair endonuclease